MDMSKCTRKCDFGYQRKFGCDVCECKCVNEYNFYAEMKYEIINNTQNMTTKFCNKICPYGYEKNEYDCYKCSCLKESTLSNSFVTLSKNPEISCPVNKFKALLFSKYAAIFLPIQNEFCSEGEICRYFNSTLFKCSYKQFDCRLYDGQEFIPICIHPNQNGFCIFILRI